MGEKLLKKTEASGLYYLNPMRRTALEASADQAKLCRLTVEITGPVTITNVLQQLGSALHFPIWYGTNFDALFDCLTDPDWQPAKGHVLLINGIAPLRSADPDDFATLIEVFQNAAEARRELGAPFWLLIDTPARGVAALPDA